MAEENNQNEKENKPFYKQQDFLQMALRAGLAMSSDAGAIAVKDEMEDREAKVKEYTDRALDYVDRMALPKLMQRNAAIAKEEKIAKMLIDQYDMSPKAIKTLANGGIGALQSFVDTWDLPKLGLKGDTLNNWVITANEVVDPDENVSDFLKRRFTITKNLLENNPSHKDAALFSSLYADPRTTAQQALEEIPIYGEFSAQDLYRFTKAGGFENTVDDKPAVFNFEQIAKDTDETQSLRMNKLLTNRAYSSFAPAQTDNQFTELNPFFAIFMAKHNGDYNKIIEDKNGKIKVAELQSDPSVRAAALEFRNMKVDYTNRTQGLTGEALTTAESQFGEVMMNNFLELEFSNIQELNNLINVITNNGRIQGLFRNYDTFKVKGIGEVRFDERDMY